MHRISFQWVDGNEVRESLLRHRPHVYILNIYVYICTFHGVHAIYISIDGVTQNENYGHVPDEKSCVSIKDVVDTHFIQAAG